MSLAHFHSSEALDQLNVVRGLLGIPYRLNSYDRKKGLDCWSCTKILQLEAFGRELPDFQADSTIKSFVRNIAEGKGLVNWVSIPEPVHGCIVELSTGFVPHHIGTYMVLPQYKINGLVHCLKGAGVVYDPWITMKAAGWRRFSYNVPR